jgi:hypothetical protein
MGQSQWMPPSAPMMGKFLFTLIVFDAHRTRVPVAWIITSRQTCDDLVEWLTPLKTKLLRKNPKWKPSRFIVDDAPQELRTL